MESFLEKESTKRMALSFPPDKFTFVELIENAGNGDDPHIDPRRIIKIN